MAVTAIKALKERTGSSGAAIKKYIVANNTITFAQHNLRMALKKGVADGTLEMVKSSYKLTEKVRVCTEKSLVQTHDQSTSIQ